MKENKISHRQLVRREDAVAYLENIVKSLKSGKIVIERNGEFVSMTAADSMNLEISAKDKKDKNEISIELSWRKQPFVPDIAPLNITSQEPPAPVEEKAAASEAKDAPNKANTDKKPAAESPKAKADANKANPKVAAAKTK